MVVGDDHRHRRRPRPVRTALIADAAAANLRVPSATVVGGRRAPRALPGRFSVIGRGHASCSSAVEEGCHANSESLPSVVPSPGPLARAVGSAAAGAVVLCFPSPGAAAAGARPGDRRPDHHREHAPPGPALHGRQLPVDEAQAGEDEGAVSQAHRGAARSGRPHPPGHAHRHHRQRSRCGTVE